MLISEQVLCERAIEACARSYAPYSHFSVGAALLTGSGRVYMAGNIENASFTPTVCAERAAFFKAISEGESEFLALAVSGGKKGEGITGAVPPCGVCRQVIAEFCPAKFPVLVVTCEEPLTFETYTLEELLPKGFSPAYLLEP